MRLATTTTVQRQKPVCLLQRSLASFSQRQELEADAIGVRTIGQAGYDPFAAGRFLGAMGQYAAYRAALTQPALRPEFLSSHPTTPERIEFAERAVEGEFDILDMAAFTFRGKCAACGDYEGHEG